MSPKFCGIVATVSSWYHAFHVKSDHAWVVRNVAVRCWTVLKAGEAMKPRVEIDEVRVPRFIEIL